MKYFNSLQGTWKLLGPHSFSPFFFVNKAFEPQTRIKVQKVIQLHNNRLALKIQNACVFCFLPNHSHLSFFTSFHFAPNTIKASSLAPSNSFPCLYSNPCTTLPCVDSLYASYHFCSVVFHPKLCQNHQKNFTKYRCLMPYL